MPTETTNRAAEKIYPYASLVADELVSEKGILYGIVFGILIGATFGYWPLILSAVVIVLSVWVVFVLILIVELFY